jgi:hypothetical protein
MPDDKPEKVGSGPIIKKLEDIDSEMLHRLGNIVFDGDLQELEKFIKEGQEQWELVGIFFRGAAKVCKTAKESGFLDEE